MAGIFKNDKSVMRILIIGNIYDNHCLRIINNLKITNPTLELSFVYTPSINAQPNLYNISKAYCAKRLFPSFIYRIPYIRYFFEMIDHERCVNSIYKVGDRFDYINVEFVSIYSILEYRLYHKLSNKVLLTPWGSDVYRMRRFVKPFIQKVYDDADYVSGEEGRFRDDFIKKFHIPLKKIVSFDIGSEMVDYILEHNDEFSKEKAKQLLGFGDMFIIECGYNASPAQNHRQIISALNNIRKKLPSNVCLIFPMTYSGQQSYLKEIESLLDKTGIKYKIYKSYLSKSDLYLVRRCADVFIHIQTTDANSAAVREYLLTETKILNGSWLRYKELEKEAVPYYLVNNMNSLERDIINCINSPRIPQSDKLVRQLRGYGWKEQAKKWNAFFVSDI